MENLQKHKYLKNVFYDTTIKQQEIEQTKRRNSETEKLEVVGNVFLNAKNEKHVLMLFLADIHYGGQGFNRDKLITTLNWAKSTGCYIGMLGDSLDMSTSESATNVQTYQTNNEKSAKALESDLEMIKTQIVEMLPGNHTAKQANRIKTLGVCMERPIAERLEVPYFPYHVLLDIITSNSHYYIGLTHGDLAKDYQTSADKLVEVIRKETGVIVDAVFMGHEHRNASFDKVYQYTEFDDETNTYVNKRKTITIESLPAFQETNEYCVTSGFEKSYANARAFDFVFDEKGDILNVISFNILNNEGKLTQTALKYQERFKLFDTETFKEKLRKKYSRKIESAKTENTIKKIAEEMIKGE